MALFKYQATDKQGQLYTKISEAADRLALYGLIRGEGGTVVLIEEVKAPGSLALLLGELLGGVKTQDKINFAKNLGAMIDAGLSMTRALGVMGKQAQSKAFQKLLASIEDDVNHGLTLSDALGKHPGDFSRLFISMVKAGEESGSVSESLKIVGNQMEKSHALVKKVRGAMIYPALIIGVMVVIAFLLLIYMVPTLTATFEGIGVQLPLPTRILIASSDFLINNTLLVISLFVALGAGGVVFYRSPNGKKLFDKLFLKIPVIGGIVQEVQAARSARTLSSLLAAGVDIVSALSVTADVLQNHLYKEVLLEAKNGIQKGEAMSAVLARHGELYPAFVSEMSSVGEETGKIAEMLKNVATYYEDEVDQKTKDLSTIIEPVLMIIIGAGVGLFAISMLAPTYSLVDYIQ
jgi:type IV pilus assembly protein PilC